MAKKRHKVRGPIPKRAVSPPPDEKATIIEACENSIATVLKPHLLPAVDPTRNVNMIDIDGDWRTGRYRFMRRYRSSMKHNAGLEWDAPFARLDYMGPNRFDIRWMRHTGQWWPLHARLTLSEALRTLGKDSVLSPL